MTGPFMASTLVFHVDIKGLSSHVGKYKEGIDALEIAARYVTEVYAAADVAYPADVNRLLRFGVFHSGKATNIVADSAHIEGTLRDYDKEVHATLWGLIEKVADDLSAEYGCTFSLWHSEPYPAVINDVKLFEDAKVRLTAAGFDFEVPDEPTLIAEDFACYQQAVPGLFMFLGTGKTTPLHSHDYEIDEVALEVGVGVFTTLLE
jgi:hippurate hydrolase